MATMEGEQVSLHRWEESNSPQTWLQWRGSRLVYIGGRSLTMATMEGEQVSLHGWNGGRLIYVHVGYNMAIIKGDQVHVLRREESNSV